MTPLSPEGRDLAEALGGQYEIAREVGRGGMGVVYLARDLKLDRAVAIKTLPGMLSGDAVVRERFLREARTAAALSHPSIVPIHRADEIGNHVFFVMGFVDGESLAQLVRDAGPLSPRTTLSMLWDVAHALGYAHDSGIVHRDVKAENILIDRASGRAMVTDFGIARLAEAAPLTATGTVLGTVHYMSPEQIAGEAVDARSDIYSLGVVAFFALSGRFPFESPTASAVLVAHVTKMAPSLSEVAPTVPGELTRVVDRCLSKDPDGRFQSCAELIQELERVEDRLPEETGTLVPAAGPGRLSSVEAQEIWKRAAELQDMTGQLPPVRPVVDGARPRVEPATSGFQLEQVRSAAEEAGISSRFVERALAERGHSRGGGEIMVREGVLPKRNPWIGGRTRIAFEAVVPGEMPERDFDLIVEAIRRTMNDAGNVSVVSRSLTWTSADSKRRVQVTVMVRDGRTTIHVSELLKDLAGGVFGGIIGGGGGGTMGPAIALAVGGLNQPWLVAPFLVMTIGTAYTVARTVFGRIHRSRSEVLHSLTERLAEEARGAIARRALVPSRLTDRKLLR